VLFAVLSESLLCANNTALSSVDGGWLNAHPLPADKSSFGNFEALAQKNNQVIQKILESESSVAPVDDEILLKLRNLYASCLDERRLDEIGTEPLLHVAKTIKRLYKGNDSDISGTQGSNDKAKGLAAAIAFLHSRGAFFILASLMGIQF
jgi:endothelin-converting enzyme